jgi:hypothetical protein
MLTTILDRVPLASPSDHAFATPAHIALTFTGLALSTLFAAASNDNDNTASKTGHFVTDEIQVYNAEIAKVGQWTLPAGRCSQCEASAATMNLKSEKGNTRG